MQVIATILAMSLVVTSLACRKRSADDGSGDLGTQEEGVVVTGTQPVSGEPSVIIKTNEDGDSDVEIGGVLLQWTTSTAAFAATEDELFSATLTAKQSSVTYAIDEEESVCNEGSWSSALSYSSAGVLSGTPSNSSVGTCTLVLTASRGSKTISRTIVVTVTDVDDAPEWTQVLGDISISEAEALNGLQVIAEDIDDDVVYTLDTANMTCDDGSWSPALSVHATTGVVTGTPSAADIGTCTVRIAAAAGSQTIYTPTITVVVADVPVPPVWTQTIASQSVAEDAPFSTSATAVDADGQAVAYSFDLPNMTCDNGAWTSALAIDTNTGAVTGTPSNDDVGSCSVKIQAVSGGDTISHTLTLTVTNVNDAPFWNPTLSDFSLSHTNTLAGRIANADDIDPGATISYSIDNGNSTCDNQSWSTSPTINSSTGELSGDPAVGNVGNSCVIRIQATSGSDVISDDVTVSVVASSTPPTWDTTIGAQSVNEDANISGLGIAADASDPDVNPTYALDLSAMTCDDGDFSTPIAIDINTGALSGVPTNDDVGTCTVRITASSGGDTISQTFTLTVLNTNDAPTWSSSIGSFSLNENTAISKTAVAADIDPGSSIVYSLDAAAMTCDNGSWSPAPSIHASTGVISGTPAHADVGSCTIKVVATSGADTLNETFTITILDVTSPSPPTAVTNPAFTTSSSQSPTVTWSASPSSPGDVNHYRASLGTSAGGTQIANNINVGMTLTHQFTSLSLVECSSYYASIKAQDASGNQSTAALANQAFKYDETAPSAPTAPILSGDATTTVSPTLSWTAGTDNCAGTVSYEVAIGTAAGLADVVTWTAASGTSRQLTSITLALNTNYYMSVRSLDGASNTSASVSSAAFRVLQTISKRVATGNDDAEQYTNGTVNLTSTDLELVDSTESASQKIGIRFVTMNIPAGATIKSAYIQFETDEATSGATSLSIWGQAADDPVTFTTTTNDIGARTKTTATVAWNSIPAWSTLGETGVNQRTPEIKTIVQEIVDRGGWLSGNDMVMILEGTGVRVAKSFNLGAGGDAPVLVVEFY